MKKNNDEVAGFSESTIELLEAVTLGVNHDEGRVTILLSLLGQMHIQGLIDGSQSPTARTERGRHHLKKAYLSNSAYFLNGILKAVSDGDMSYKDGYRAYELFNKTFRFQRFEEFEKDLKEVAKRGENEKTD